MTKVKKSNCQFFSIPIAAAGPCRDCNRNGAAQDNPFPGLQPVQKCAVPVSVAVATRDRAASVPVAVVL